MTVLLDPVVRAMTLADLPVVTRNETRAYAFPWTPGQLADSVAGRDLCWVLESPARASEPSRLVGHAIVSEGAGEAHLLNLCIARDQQGRGLGGVLLDFVRGDLLGRGVSMLFLEVRESNRSACALYLRAGFRDIGVRRDYYPSPLGREDARVMALALR